jgi:chromosome segregation ATPase
MRSFTPLDAFLIELAADPRWDCVKWYMMPPDKKDELIADLQVKCAMQAAEIERLTRENADLRAAEERARRYAGQVGEKQGEIERLRTEFEIANSAIAEVRETLVEFNAEDVQVMARRARDEIEQLRAALERIMELPSYAPDGRGQTEHRTIAREALKD